MLLSKECDYGLRIMRNLSEDHPTSVSNIVTKENMTLAMGYKIARKLELAGLIRSQRGHSGGYFLGKGLDQITMLDVYKAIEPNLALTACTQYGSECPLNTKQSPCKVHAELQRIHDLLFAELSAKSLAQIVAE